MRPAGELGDACIKQGFVAGKVIDHQGATPVAEEASRMRAGTTLAIVEDDNGLTFGKRPPTPPVKPREL
jgi:hypothetical protein